MDDNPNQQKKQAEYGAYQGFHPALTALLLFFMAVIGFLSYSNTFQSPFVLDDGIFVLNNPASRITQLTPETLFRAAIDGRPARRLIPNASFALNYYFGRYAPAGYHLLNIVIHLLAAVFLYFFTKHTITVSGPYRHPLPAKQKPYTLSTAPEFIAFFAALIWMVHPVQTQAVTYICQRMTSLVALFYILSLLLYVKGRMAMQAGNTGWVKIIVYFAGCLAAGICAVASKQNAGTLPLIILVYEWFFFQDLKLFHSKKSLLLMAAVAVIFAVIAISYLGDAPIKRILAGYAHRDFTPSQRVMTEWRVILYYVSLLFWPAPSRLNLDHDYPLSFSLVTPETTLLSLTAIAGLIFMALAVIRKDRLLSFIIIWFLGTLAIESSIIGIEIIFEHRNYLPSMLVAVGVVVMIFRLFRDKRIAYGLLCLLAVSCAFWTYQRNTVWETNLSILKDCVKKSPRKIRPRQNLATDLLLQGHTSLAADLFHSILKIDPTYINAYNNLGNLMVRQNDIRAAFDYYIAALKVTPESNKYHIKDLSSVHFNLGSILFYRRMFEEAEFHFLEGLQLDPENDEMHSRLGQVLLELKKIKMAEKHFNRAVRLNPDNLSAKKFLDQIKKMVRRNAPDSQNTDKIPKILNKNDILYFKLACLYKQQKNYSRAIKAFQKSLNIHPENALAASLLNECLRKVVPE